MRNKRGKLLGFMLTLALVIGLLPVMSLTAYADNSETLLTTITPTSDKGYNETTPGVVTVTLQGDMHYFTGVWEPDTAGSVTVVGKEGYTITKCIFHNGYLDQTKTATTQPFVVYFNAAELWSVASIEVYGYAMPAATHSVTITAGDHMTKTADSGETSQTDLSGAMTDVVYTADNGYYYPTDYSVAEVSGIKVTRDSYTQITVSGTPTADAAIALTAPTAKTTPDAPTTAAAVDCTTADNNDGKLTGVTAAMEYKKSDADSWTAGTGSDITGLVPGTYYVRVKATDTTNASGNQELTIKGFISYTVTFKVVNGKWNDETTADKTVTLTGYEGDTLKLAATDIPAVGNKPNDTYKAGSWDVTPSTDTEITADTTYTYTYAQKEAATVTKAPKAKTLTYTGSAQSLVTAGTAAGGEMRYALGNATEATEPYTTSIPTATDAGTYYVWYKVLGDTNHKDSAPAVVSVTMTLTRYTITYEMNGGSNSENNPSSYTMKSEDITLSSPAARNGYTFRVCQVNCV